MRSGPDSLAGQAGGGIETGTRIGARLSALAGVARFALDLARRRAGLLKTGRVRYLVPGAGWSTDWDGHYITSHVRSLFGVDARVASRSRWLVGAILHHSSMWSFLGQKGSPRHRRNRVVVTVFHGNRSERFPELKRGVEEVLEGLSEVDALVTSCRLMEQRFLDWGAPRAKLRCIPLGVDLARFRPPGPGERERLRQRLGIPEEAFCLGSFHKDGNGWGEGLTPKLIKGPDLFLDVVGKLKDRFRVFVCLSGPARGYVKQGLERLGVDYHHVYFEDYRQVASLYHCLDSYLVTSREEGGPKGVLESLACGIPLVSTRVGLAPDVIEHGRNGLLAEQEDVEALAGHLTALREDPSLGQRLARQGLSTIKDYDWPLIAARYYREVYEPLLGQGR